MRSFRTSLQISRRDRHAAEPFQRRREKKLMWQESLVPNRGRHELHLQYLNVSLYIYWDCYSEATRGVGSRVVVEIGPLVISVSCA
jgi:hypothetical protein